MLKRNRERIQGQEGQEQKMKGHEMKEQVTQEQIATAMATLENFIVQLAVAAGEGETYGAQLWEKICKSRGVLQEVAYYHDYGTLWCKHQVAGYTLADILVWQVDHFKAYLDRPTEMNRYHKEKLVLAAFDVMLQMEADPQKYIEKMSSETGTDFEGKY